MSWAPGEGEFIKDKLIMDGGWFAFDGAKVYNLYRGPSRVAKAGPVDLWTSHIVTLYGDEGANHILDWFASRVQHPEVKINHALVLGGPPGIGKDTLLAPLREAVGEWNFAEVSPAAILDKFNPWAMSVVLRISEAKDLGDRERFVFYDHSKSLIAAPPEVIVVNPKHIRPYTTPNLTGVIITTNYEKHGIYLPANDRRHYVAWSDKERGYFETEPGYWAALWGWYENGGYEACMDFLLKRDLKAFNPKAPPKQTEAFFRIVEGYRPSDVAAIEEALNELGHPKIVTWRVVVSGVLSTVDRDRLDTLAARNKSPAWLKECGYEAAYNPEGDRGRFKINGRWVTIYVNVKKVTPEDRLAEARKLNDQPDAKAPSKAAEPPPNVLPLSKNPKNEGEI
jgi:Family of unknown function (DUF5906)